MDVLANLKALERQSEDNIWRTAKAAGDEISRLRHEREQLAKAIRDAAVKAGICREDVPLTGPDLLMLCMDMGVALTANAAVTGGESEA